MSLFRRRMAWCCVFTLLVQMTVLLTAVLACCQDNCLMHHGSQATEHHSSDLRSGAHCAMQDMDSAGSADLADLGFRCACSDDQAIDLLLGASGILVSKQLIHNVNSVHGRLALFLPLPIEIPGDLSPHPPRL